MTVDIRHNFVSTVPSSGDPSIVQGPNWNEAHILQQGPTALLGRSDVAGSQQPTQEIPLDPATMQFTAGGALGAKAQPSPAPTYVTMNGWLQRPVNVTIGVQLNTPIPNAFVGMMLMVQTAGIMRIDGMNTPTDNGVYNLTNVGDVINAPAVTQIPAGSAVTIQQAVSAGTGISLSGTTLYPTINATGAPPTGAAGGDLTGTYPNPTLNPAGTLNLYAMVQSPHFTGSPAAPTPPTADNSISIATTQYVKANLAALPTSYPPSGAAGGQLTGTYPNPTIAGGTDGYVLTSQLGQALWTAPGAPPTGIAGGMLSGAYPNPNIRPSVTNGQVMTTVGGASAWATPPATLPPSGAAGGGLAGTYPNPSIAPSATNGQVLTTIGGVSQWAAPGGGPPTGAAGGILSGTYPNPGFVSGVGAPLQLYSEQVLAALANVLPVNFPTTARMVELVWDISVTPTADVGIALIGTQGGTPITSANYTLQRLYGQGSTSGADQVSSATTGWSLITGFDCRAAITFTKPSGGRGTGSFGAVATSGVRTSATVALEGPTGLDGYRLSCASGNFTIGSYMRCLVLP